MRAHASPHPSAACRPHGRLPDSDGAPLLSAAVNNARIPLECIADVTHVASGRTQRIAMGASCKIEACFVPEDIWRGAADGLSADFVPIGSLD